MTNHRLLCAVPTTPTSSAALLATIAVGLGAVLTLAGCSRKAEPVEVVIAIEKTAGPVSEATLLVDYSQAGASPLIAGGEPACASIQPHVDMRFSDDGGGAMSIDAGSEQGFSGPLDVAVCRMVPSGSGITAESIKARLRVSVLTATGPDGRKVAGGRVARADGGRAASRSGAGAGSAPIGRIEPSLPDSDGAARRPAMPQGEPTRRARGAGAGSNAAGAAAGRAATGAPADPYDAVEDSVEELLARRGTSTERRAPAMIMDELDQKSAALAETDAPTEDATQDEESAVNDPSAVSYTVTVGVTSGAGRLAALQFDVRYTGDGDWLGGSGSVVCSTHPQVALATYNNRGQGWYSAAMIDLEGFDAVGPIATCRILSRDSVSAGDFSVVVIDASTPTPDGGDPDPYPQMGVTDIRADG